MVAPLAAYGIGAGLSAVAGSQAAKKQKTAEKNRKREILNLLRGMQGTVEESLPLQEMYLRKSNAAALEGYKSGLADVDRAESAGAEDIARMGQASLRAARGAAAQAGITGGSGGTNLTMAAARDTARNLRDFQMGIARQRSGLRIAQGQAKSSGLGQLANFQAYKASARNNVLNPYFQWLAGSPVGHPQSLNLAGLGAGAAWAAAGAPGMPSSGSHYSSSLDDFDFEP